MSRRSRRAAEALAARRRGEPGDQDVSGGRGPERAADGWTVRPAFSATVAYRCPGCDQAVAPGTPHVVAWPDGGLDDRRHWHSPCWAARTRRRPTPRHLR